MKNNFEAGPEQIPTREEVVGVIERFAENSIFVRELSDEQGLYLLEVEVGGDKPGETIGYEYIRQGQFSNNVGSTETVIHIVYYEDGVPVGGHNIANYNSGTRMWEDVK